MEIRTRIKKNEGRISLYEGEHEAGYLTFSIKDKRALHATHTVVHQSYQGQGLARLLVDALIEWAEQRTLIIVPVCSYIVAIAERSERLKRLLESYDDSESYVEQLKLLGNAEKAKQAMRFFKTRPGEYGEGDAFLGVSVPELRSLRINKDAPRGFKQRQLSETSIRSLWASPYHEARLLACQAIADWAVVAEHSNTHLRIYELYLAHADRCNNWDLVDSSAPQVMAMYLADKDDKFRRETLLALAQSESLWQQRISIVGTLGLIRLGLYQDTFAIAEALLTHEHDLIHKATGWMLREVGKHGGKLLLMQWLDTYAPKLARTALRYAIEHFNEAERQHYLSLR